MSPPDAAGGALRAQDARSGTTSPAYDSLIAADGAVAYWRLGESSGTTRHRQPRDEHRHLRRGAAVGRDRCAQRRPNTAVTFPGVGDYASIPDASALDFGNGPFTVEFWYKASTANTLRFLLSKGNQFNVYMNGTGNLTVDNDNTAAVQVGPGKGIGADTTNWHHFVVTRTGSGPTAHEDLPGRRRRHELRERPDVLVERDAAVHRALLRRRFPATRARSTRSRSTARP